VRLARQRRQRLTRSDLRLALVLLLVLLLALLFARGLHHGQSAAVGRRVPFRPRAHTEAEAYAAGLVLAAELAYWSLEAPREWGLVRRRALLAAALGGASSAVAALVVAVASASSGRSVAFELVAFAGVAAALLLVARLARSSAARARSTSG
jgi:hypothetical protein